MIEKGLAVMDMTAFTLCRESALPIVVFDVAQPGVLVRLLHGEAIGTRVEWGADRART